MTDARDTRPIYSQMPEAMRRVFDDFGPRLEELFADLWDASLAVGDLDNPACAVNDALSLQSEMASFCAALFLERLIRLKPEVDPRAVAVAAEIDVVVRFKASAEKLIQGMPANAND